MVEMLDNDSWVTKHMNKKDFLLKADHIGSLSSHK